MLEMYRSVSFLRKRAHGVGQCIIIALICVGCAFVSRTVLGVEITNNYFDTIEDLRGTPQTSSRGADLALDHAVTSSLDFVFTTLALWESDHFAAYLLVVSTLAGLGVGIIAALLAHYGADPRAHWTEVRKKTTWLSAGCGLGVAVFLVGVMLSVPAHGRFSYLVLAAATCASGAALACSMWFTAVRWINQRRAAMSGLMFSEERMKGLREVRAGTGIHFSPQRTTGPSRRATDKD